MFRKRLLPGKGEEPELPPVHLDSIPSGIVVKAGKDLYYIKGNRKLKILSERILKSQGFCTWMNVTKESLAKYRTSGKLGFRDGTIILSIVSNGYYLISDGKKRLITNPDFLTNFPADIYIVSLESYCNPCCVYILLNSLFLA